MPASDHVRLYVFISTKTYGLAIGQHCAVIDTPNLRYLELSRGGRAPEISGDPQQHGNTETLNVLGRH